MERSLLLRRFDDQLRRRAIPADPLIRVERDEQLVLWIGDADGGVWSGVIWSGLDTTTAGAAIERAIARYASDGLPFEWKLYGHDQPADLRERLLAAGLTPGEEETVLVADLSDIAPDATPPAGMDTEVICDGDGVRALVELHERVFGGDHEQIGQALLRALDREPLTAVGVLCTVDGVPVSAARVEFDEGSEFATIWGGCTLPDWRGRGAYRALVGLRAQLARERGYRYLEVDALPTSRPILERLGFVPLTTTTPLTGVPGRVRPGS
jgi:GNAT superfamily N-acetyltransferase